MFPVSTKGGGTAAAAPDTCKTPSPPAPPVPIPYPNTAELSQALDPTCSMRVKIANSAVVTKDTKIPTTTGDEAGAVGGVVSGMIKGEASFKVGVVKVKVEGVEVINQMKPCMQNGSSANAPTGVVVAPSQVKVIVSG